MHDISARAKELEARAFCQLENFSLVGFTLKLVSII